MPQTDPAAPRRGAVAALVTVACHVLFLLLLWVLKLSTDRPAPKPTEVLIAVNVGNVASAAGPSSQEVHPTSLSPLLR